MKTVSTLFFVFVCSIFASEEIKPIKKNVLIAIEKTPFKEALAKELKVLLEKDSISVIMVIHNDKGLKIEKAENYTAIFISNSGVNAKVRPWITKWINENANLNGKVILHTTQKSNWKVVADVDAVTSASNKKQVSELAKQYKELIIKK